MEETPAPSAVNPEIVAPEKSPLAERPRVEPRAAPLTTDAVTSPPKRLSDCTWLVAVAVPAVPESLATEALIEPVVTTEPSLGYAKLEPNAAWYGGDEIEPASEPDWPGTTTRIATARADAPAVEPAPPAPPAPASRTRRPASATKIVSRFPTVPALSAITATARGFLTPDASWRTPRSAAAPRRSARAARPRRPGQPRSPRPPRRPRGRPRRGALRRAAPPSRRRGRGFRSRRAGGPAGSRPECRRRCERRAACAGRRRARRSPGAPPGHARRSPRSARRRVGSRVPRRPPRQEA